MDNAKTIYLNAMDIQTWQLKHKSASCTTLEGTDPSSCHSRAGGNLFITPSIDTRETLKNVNSIDWDTLRANVAQCTACSLHQSRTQTVFGVGNPTADLMIIGEAPGFYEDKQGEPFVGRAGQLLNSMLQAINFTRDNVYIANILKCRPPQNRDPSPEEVGLCTSFLEKQIKLVQPKLLLALGRISSHYLLNTKTPLNQLRGKIYKYENIPLIITYHPAYLLRNPLDKKKAFQDLQFTIRTLLTFE